MAETPPDFREFDERFVSAEPLLGALDLSRYLVCEQYAGEWKEPRKGTIGGQPYRAARFRQRVDWLIVGAESGPNARPMDDTWVRSLRDQCQATETAFFFKQRCHHGRKETEPMLDGRTWLAYPKDNG